MSDAYLLATPLLVLGVLAIVRFVGCYSPPVLPPPEPCTNLTAEPGNQQITLTWEPGSQADWFVIKRGAAVGAIDEIVGQVPGTTQPLDTQTTFVDQNLANGLRKFYVVISTRETPQGHKESIRSNVADAVPGIGLLVSFTLGTLRTDPFTGWVGMLIRVAANPVVVFGLGRIFIDGSTGKHEVKIVDATTTVDVPGAATVVDLKNAGVADKTIAYGALPMPVTLAPNAEYYVVSQEIAGGDHFYDLDTTVLTSGVAAVTSAVFGDGVASYTRGGGAGQTYGPVDLLI